MNTVKNNFIKILFGIFLITSFASCDEGGDPSKEEIGMTTTGMYAGDWFVDLTDSDGNVLVEHALHMTYNTSANDNTMWLADEHNGYYIKTKIIMNVATGQFYSDNSVNIDDGGTNDTTVTITDGQIIKNGGLSKAGHVVDKIVCRIHYSYDAPGYDILYEGHKRTGFGEDEY